MKTVPIKKAIKKLKQLGGDTRHSDSVVSYWRTSFGTAIGGDYGFSTYIYENGGASLSASRVEIEEDEYFWSHSYEMADFENDDELLNNLIGDVNIVLQSRTRVLQSKGLFLYSFSCEYLQDGKWRCLWKNSAFRLGGFRFPRAKQKVTEYSSPPLISSNKMRPNQSLETDA
jgi:hypothetical protein